AAPRDPDRERPLDLLGLAGFRALARSHDGKRRLLGRRRDLDRATCPGRVALRPCRGLDLRSPRTGNVSTGTGLEPPLALCLLLHGQWGSLRDRPHRRRRLSGASAAALRSAGSARDDALLRRSRAGEALETPLAASAAEREVQRAAARRISFDAAPRPRR